jgi:hypothetical protein
LSVRLRLILKQKGQSKNTIWAIWIDSSRRNAKREAVKRLFSGFKKRSQGLRGAHNFAI